MDILKTYFDFSPNSLLWGSLFGKKGWPRWPRYAMAAPPNCVHLVSALCPLCPRLQTNCLPCVHHTSTMWPPCSCSLSAQVRSWPIRALASSSKILSRHCATHSVYIACWSVSLAFWLPKFGPMLEKLFGIYAGIIHSFCQFILRISTTSKTSLCSSAKWVPYPQRSPRAEPNFSKHTWFVNYALWPAGRGLEENKSKFHGRDTGHDVFPRDTYSCRALVAKWSIQKACALLPAACFQRCFAGLVRSKCSPWFLDLWAGKDCRLRWWSV